MSSYKQMFLHSSGNLSSWVHSKTQTKWIMTFSYFYDFLALMFVLFNIIYYKNNIKKYFFINKKFL